jgi:hypothetical protein
MCSLALSQMRFIVKFVAVQAIAICEQFCSRSLPGHIFIDIITVYMILKQIEFKAKPYQRAWLSDGNRPMIVDRFQNV